MSNSKTSSKTAGKPQSAAQAPADSLATQAQPEAPSTATQPVVSHRQTLPPIPTGLQGFSARSACVQIYGYAEKLGRGRDPGTIKTLTDQLARVSTKHLHPAVGNYKAEMLDYLRGLASQV